jgi:hypothetical protein
MVENVLAEHDSELLEFYCEVKVKTDLYAWTLLEMAFSEVCNLIWYGMVIKLITSLQVCVDEVMNGVFWVVTLCGSCKNRRFGGTWRHLLQGDKNR